MRRFAGLLRTSGRQLSDFPNTFQMDSRWLVSGAAAWLAPPDGLQNSACAEIQLRLRKGSAPEDFRGGLECKNCRRLEAASNVRQDDPNRVGQALADSYGLSLAAVRSLTLETHHHKICPAPAGGLCMCYIL